MDDLPDRLPYGVDTIVLRMTWENPARRPLPRGRWDIARGVGRRYPSLAAPLASGSGADIVPVADEKKPAGPPLALPFPFSSRPSLLSPDSRPPTLYPLAPSGLNEIPPFAGAGGSRGGSAPGGRTSPQRPAPSPSTQAIPNPSSPEQQLRLRRELERTGQIQPGDGREAHRVVPQGGNGMTGQRDPGRAQDVLRQFGIDMNSVENGTALSRDFHRQIHTNVYYAYVDRNLSALATREEVAGWLSRFRQQLRDADHEFQQSGQLPSWITGAAP